MTIEDRIRQVKEAREQGQPNRATGRTTRLIDYYIQELFIKGEILVKDHDSTRDIDRRLFRLVFNRLSNEHSWLWQIQDYIIFDKVNFTIKLKQVID